MIAIFITLLSLVSGTIFYLVAHKYLVAGFDAYERRSMSQFSSGLADNFMFMEPRTLFLGTMISMAVAGILALTTLGVIAAVIVIFLVAGAPFFILKFLKKKRVEKFVYQLPDCLSTVQMSLRAGSNFSRALSMVVEQQPAPISQELALVVAEARMGRSIEDALHSMYERVQSSEVELFVSAVAISRSVGGNLADTLESLSDTIRERLQIEGKIRALTAMGRAQGWVVGLLPLLVAYMLYKREPESISAFVTEPLGWLLSTLMILMACLAIYMIRKIIDIDV